MGRTGSVYNHEYRHTSLIATLRKTWGLGEPFTQRDASARTFDHVFSLAAPRDPQTWAMANKPKGYQLVSRRSIIP